MFLSLPIIPHTAPGITAFLILHLHGTIPTAMARELKVALRQAQEVDTDYRCAQKQFFAQFDTVLDRAPIGPNYFESEKMAKVLAGEIMMLQETGFTVHGFAILPNHAHAVLHLPENSNRSFAKALDLLHLRTDTAYRRLVRPKLPPEAKFWQVGWSNYKVADEAELTRVLTYVRGNARQAGLSARFQE